MEKALKLITLGLVAFLFLAVAPAYAAQPQTVVTTATNNYIEIISPTNDYLKVNTTYAFQYHLFNSSNGLPFTAKDNISCVFHLYALLGTHQYVSNTAAINDNIYDVGITVAAGNFTKGFYNVLVQCNTTTIGGAIKQQFEVTRTGIAPSQEYTLIFLYIMIFAVVAALIYLLFFTIEKFAMLKVDVKVVAMNLAAYIALFVMLAFDNAYVGDLFISSTINLWITLGAIGNIIVPFTGFVITLVTDQLQKMGRIGIRGEDED